MAADIPHSWFGAATKCSLKRSGLQAGGCWRRFNVKDFAPGNRKSSRSNVACSYAAVLSASVAVDEARPTIAKLSGLSVKR